MKLLAAVVLVAGLAGVAAWGGEAFAGDEHRGTCVFEKLTGQDYKFCRGDLEVFYPELGDVGCTYIPKCNQYRKRISKEWRSPKIAYPQADKNKKYVLIMVDPDAPNRANPKYRFWRHWIVIDIKVSLFLLCDLCRHLMMNLCDTTIIPMATHSVLGIGYPFHSRDNLRSETLIIWLNRMAALLLLFNLCSSLLSWISALFPSRNYYGSLIPCCFNITKSCPPRVVFRPYYHLTHFPRQPHEY
ncbi:phosphatidylethanolamine-binding protein 4 isoform X2 [Chrysemys picta bellii]